MYQLIPVSERLSPYVDCFWQSNFDTLGKEVYAELFNAQCTPNLIFNIGSSYQLNEVEVKNSVLHGFNASPVRYAHTADNELFGIRFRPLGLSMFTKLPYLVLHNAPISIADVFGTIATEFENKLAEAPDIQTKGMLCETFLLKIIQEKNKSQYKIAHSLWQAIELNTRTENSIENLAKTLHCTHRSFDRYSKQLLGFSPKKLSRILRFNRALNTLNHAKVPEQDFDFHQFGYYDQSHFIKEFCTFLGLSPHSYLSSPHFVQNLQSGH